MWQSVARSALFHVRSLVPERRSCLQVQAEKMTMLMQGQGIARQRQAIISGLRDSVMVGSQNACYSCCCVQCHAVLAVILRLYSCKPGISQRYSNGLH